MKKLIPINVHTLKTKIFTSNIEISRNGEVIEKIVGIEVKPLFMNVEPVKIKDSLVKKEDSGKSIDEINNDLLYGVYYTNIIDYSFTEIIFISNLLTDNWIKENWELFINEPNKNQLTVNLNTEKKKKYLLEFNSSKFKNDADIDKFIDKYNIDIDTLVIPAKFNEFAMSLLVLNAWLSSEIIYFRRKMFTELFIKKFDSKIFKLLVDKEKKIFELNNDIYNNWKKNQIENLNNYKLYNKSPFIFDDDEQYDFVFNHKKKKENIHYDELIPEINYWLESYPKAKTSFEFAVKYYLSREDIRGCLDNARLTLELLLKQLLKNEKSLENQLSNLSSFQKDKGIAAEITSMFVKIIDYYSKYQNKNVKHNIDINVDYEVDFIFGITLVFIRMLIKPVQKN